MSAMTMGSFHAFMKIVTLTCVLQLEVLILVKTLIFIISFWRIYSSLEDRYAEPLSSPYRIWSLFFLQNNGNDEDNWDIIRIYIYSYTVFITNIYHARARAQPGQGCSPSPRLPPLPRPPPSSSGLGWAWARARPVRRIYLLWVLCLSMYICIYISNIIDDYSDHY